jgi:hypothetical protein
MDLSIANIFSGAAAAVLGASVIGFSRSVKRMYEMVEKQTQQISELSGDIRNLRERMTIVESQMVGWDTLTRMERSLGLLATAGKGSEAMSAMASALRVEIDSHKERQVT